MIPLPRDFQDFLRLLNANAIRYLVIGGYAVALSSGGGERAWTVALGRVGFHGRLFLRFVILGPVSVGDSGF
jgi:hypothetical protein